MKKWWTALCIILVIGAFFGVKWAEETYAGEQVVLLDVLPQGEWRDFDGGHGNPTNRGHGMNVDEWRGEDCPWEIPEEIAYTTVENVRKVLEGKQVRRGIFKKYMKEDFFQYDFTDEADNEISLFIYVNGCIIVRVTAPGEPVYQEVEFRDKGACYAALKEAFGDLHDYRQWMGIPD